MVIKQRGARAVQHLPGPDTPGFFGILSQLAKRRDAHRLLTEYAEEHGPLFRVRTAFMQVPFSRVLPRGLVAAWCSSRC